MKRLLNKIFFRGFVIKEYLTITVEKPIQQKVYLNTGRNFIDISVTHWLLCLEPMSFGVWVNKNEEVNFYDNYEAKIYFTDTTCDGKKAAKRFIANLTVKLSGKLEDENGTLLLFEVIKSTIKLLSPLKTFFIFYLYYKKARMSFEKFKSLVAAFSYPRKVCLISFQKDDYYNIFPMDLLGQLNDCNNYVFGLRHTNSALEKIIEAKKMIVSEVSFKYKDIIYELGKHHSTKAPPINSLPYEIIQSKTFGFPVPEFVHNYKEIEILTSLNLGTQMLLFGKKINEVDLKSNEGNLYHIHFLLFMHQKKKKIDAGYKVI